MGHLYGRGSSALAALMVGGGLTERLGPGGGVIILIRQKYEIEK